MNDPHVVVDALDITYRDDGGHETHAVRRASLTLARGETLGIVGESGSGKSTLARALMGYARPGARFAGGSVRVGGIEAVPPTSAAARALQGRRVAMVPQNPLSSLTPHLPVGRQLAELVRRHTALRGRAARDRILWLLDRTGLAQPEGLIRRYPHEISGGQRQRVVIAAALIGHPELIILDEPTTALDKAVEAEVLQLVSELQAELEATLVYVSHDLNVIRAMCRTVAVMKEGRVLELGPLDRIYSRPATGYTRQLIASIPRITRQGPPRPAQPAAGAGLSIRNLSFSYPGPGRGLARVSAGRPTLQDISLEIAPGETLGVVGESGSGKSTLAALVAGVLSGHTGEIRLGGDRLSGRAASRPPEQRRRVQMVFQDPLSSLNPAQDVGQILARPRRLYFGRTAAEARADCIELLREVDLGPDILTRRPRQLSGGQQQRIAICRALAAEPDLLVCDEVTSALDVTIQGKVLDLLRGIQRRRGLGCLFISHDLAVVARMSHTVAVFQQGRLVEAGPRDKVLLSPDTGYCRRLMAR